ncbi:erythroferrone [Clinocottus analis]|uniref:erythroferrone n=1 Tax=Clinocottus analis TaxID=304258 RepID=UPI0035C18FAD
MLVRLNRGRSSLSGSGGLMMMMTMTMVMMTMMMMMMMMVTEAASVEEESEESEEILEVLEDEAVSTEELLSSGRSRVSPLSSWIVFRRNSNKGDNRRTRGPRRPSKHGLPGPPGPPGPRGPPGPPAPLRSQQEEKLLQELQLKLRGGVCVQCVAPPRVSTSFLTRLLEDVIVPRRSLLELQPFSQPSDSELRLQRGRSFNSSSGRFTASVSGFYQLTASLLIETGERVQLRLRDSLRAAICIQSLCQSNLSVESVMGVGATGGMFSILLTGTLYLQDGEYVSVFLDNSSGSSVSVLQDSLFSGILFGV